MRTEGLDRDACEWLPLRALPGLRLLVRPQLLGQAKDRPPWPNGSGVKVDVHPPQSDGLAAAQARRQVDDPQWLQTVAPDGSQQRSGFLRTVRRWHVGLGQPRWISQRGDVARQPAVLDGPLQRSPQDAAEVDDGLGAQPSASFSDMNRSM
jgi:hypothetical protein